MEFKDIRKGQRVIPISKSTQERKGLENSAAWGAAKKRGQHFLYVIDKIDEDCQEIVLSDRKNATYGDLFLPSDLKNY